MTASDLDLQPTLTGRLVTLRPLRADDFPALYAVAADPLIWAQHPDSDRYKEEVFREFFRVAMASGGAFLVHDARTARVIGSSRFHAYDRETREVEIGWTFLARSHWGGACNREMKALMLRHAFQAVDRVLFLVGLTNLRSQRAMEKIGGVRAGTRANDTGRTSVVFEITAKAFAAAEQKVLRLCLPEWQGYGLGQDVDRGARALAAALFGGREFVTIDAPAEETLHQEDGVLGLHSIAPRFEHTLARIRREAPARIVTVGGTCGVELAPVAYLNERYAGDLAVLWLDAHADLNTPASSPSGHFHGMALRTLLGEGPVACTRAMPMALVPGQIFLAGARDLDPPEAEYIVRNGIPVLPDDALRDPVRCIARVRKGGFRHLYVHFDVDVLDPAGFPGALMPTPAGGPSLGEAAALFRELGAAFDIVGASVLEYCDRVPGWTPAVAAAFAQASDPAL